eukprot:1452281-Amphidinium_carterae.2
METIEGVYLNDTLEELESTIGEERKPRGAGNSRRIDSPRNSLQDLRTSQVVRRPAYSWNERSEGGNLPD